MREQVISPRAGRASAGARSKGRASGGQTAQRPARRGKSAGKSGQAGQRVFSWRGALHWAPAVMKFALAVVAGLLVFAGYRAAASAPFFQLKKVEVIGASRSSRDEIDGAVRRVVGAGGVWNADLDAMTREVEELQWVRAAQVQRVLPSGLRVRVFEREPRMVARTTQGRLVWVDDEGVRLGPASADDADFFVRGLDEDRDAEARTRNRERLAVAARLRDDWAREGLAGRVSEVNLHDLRDVRVQLTGEDAGVEVQLSGGDRLASLDHPALFREAMAALARERRKPYGEYVSYVIKMPGKDPVIGYPTEVHLARQRAQQTDAGADATTAPARATPARAVTAAPGRGATRREQNRGDAAAEESPRGAVRERRVGRG